MNHDLEIAKSIQQKLLPAQALKLDDYEIAGWNQQRIKLVETTLTGKLCKMGGSQSV